MCKKRAEMCSFVCVNEEDDRCLQKTWTSVELKKAIELRYVVKEVYEIYNYEQKGRSFENYVNTF